MGLTQKLKFGRSLVLSTLLFSPLALAQSGDELYLQLRKSPHADKETSDRAQAETLDKKRLDQYHQDIAEMKRRAIEDQKQIAKEPKPTAEQIAEEEKQEASGVATSSASGRSAPGGNSRSAPPPPPSAPASSDSPKVAFDPMPDEIQFDGEPDAPKQATKPKITTQRGAKPMPRQIKTH